MVQNNDTDCVTFNGHGDSQPEYSTGSEPQPAGISDGAPTLGAAAARGKLPHQS